MNGKTKAEQYPIFLLFQADNTPVKLMYFLDDDPATMVAFVQTLFAHAREYRLSESFVAGAIRGACDMLHVYEQKKLQQNQAHNQQQQPGNFFL